jgi:hypothetical protein
MTQLAKISNQSPFQTNEIDVFKLGEVFAKSGYFTDAKDASQAIVKILAGREIGVGAMASMSGIHLVQGKPTLSANLIASLIKNKNSGYNYRVLEMSETVCEIEFFERGESIGKSKFTIEEAKNAGLTGKDVWKKFAKNMLFARAISNGAKWFCPDIFNGVPVYSPEEMGAEVNLDGEFIPEKATIHRMPTKKELTESSLPVADPLNDQLNDICNKLNDGHDSISWTPSKLTDYARELFEENTLKNWKHLEAELKEILIGDLTQRLEEILAIQSENVMEAEAETIEA